MTNRSPLVLMSTLLIGLAIALGAEAQPEVVEDPSGGSGPSASLPSPAGATIEVRHNKLSPNLVQIAAGQTVTFHNVDKMPGGHTVMATDGSFSSPALDQGQEWSHSFDVPGVYPIRIKEHPGAEASIVVE